MWMNVVWKLEGSLEGAQVLWRVDIGQGKQHCHTVWINNQQQEQRNQFLFVFLVSMTLPDQEQMHPLCPVWHGNTGPRQFSEVDLCMICIRLDEGGDCDSSAVQAGPGGSGWVYLAVRRPGCVLQSCGWRNCAYLRRRPAGWATRAGGKPGGRRVAAPPAQRPPRTTSSGTGQSLPGLQ